jgi:hypothetical protein
MYRDMKLISPDKPKPTRALTRGDYNAIAHAKLVTRSDCLTLEDLISETNTTWGFVELIIWPR